MTKARACEGVGQEWRSGVTFHAPGSVRECEGMNLTLPNELPFWELESPWTLESSNGDFRGQIDGIEKFLISLNSSWNLDI